MRALPGILLAATLAGSARAESERVFVDAGARIPNLIVEMRYHGDRNFVGRAVAGYDSPRCLLTSAAVAGLRRAQRGLAVEGLGLKVFDCYRPARAVADFVAWASDAADTGTKAAYYPDIDKRDLFRLGYIAERSAHSRGSTVDLTLVRLADGHELDMGTPFDFFGPASAPASPLVTPEQAGNRSRLRRAMIRAGFKPYAEEWWHFTLRREPYPTRIFDVPVR